MEGEPQVDSSYWEMGIYSPHSHTLLLFNNTACSAQTACGEQSNGA